MSQGQMFPEQMSLGQLASVEDGPRNLSLKFGQNRHYPVGWVAGWVAGWVDNPKLRPPQPELKLKLR